LFHEFPMSWENTFFAWILDFIVILIVRNALLQGLIVRSVVLDRLLLLWFEIGEQMFLGVLILSWVLSTIVFIHWTDQGSTVFIQLCLLDFFSPRDEVPLAALSSFLFFFSLDSKYSAIFSGLMSIYFGLIGISEISTPFLWLSLSLKSLVSSMLKMEYLLSNDSGMGLVSNLFTVPQQNPS
jgi:hypothetical protein